MWLMNCEGTRPGEGNSIISASGLINNMLFIWETDDPKNRTRGLIYGREIIFR